jgi:hypothetical protein
VDNPVQRAIQKMGGDFLVAAFIPSMAFIVICSITFESLLPKPLRYNGEDVFQSSLNLLLFTTILGFTLHTLSTYIYKIFEGYTTLFRNKNLLGRSFLERQKRRFRRIEKERARVEKQLEKIEKKIDGESEPSAGSWRAKRYNRYLKLEQSLKDRRYDLIATREMGFPPSLNSIMPTRFGNILKAAETYPVTRYSIDSVQLWGRLSHVIPDSGMQKIDHASNQSLFLLNSTILAVVFTLLCIGASLYQGGILWLYINGNNPVNLTGLNLSLADYQHNIIVEVVLALLASATALFFYEASLFNVSQFGDMIRAAYDLYRFNLLEALHLGLPDSLREERQVWRGLSEFMVGNEIFGPMDFSYQHPPRLPPTQHTPTVVGDEE